MLAGTVCGRAVTRGLLVGPSHGELGAVVWVLLSFLGCPTPVGGILGPARGPGGLGAAGVAGGCGARARGGDARSLRSSLGGAVRPAEGGGWWVATVLEGGALLEGRSSLTEMPAHWTLGELA